MQFFIPSIFATLVAITPAFSQGVNTADRGQVNQALIYAQSLYQQATPASQYLYLGKEYGVSDRVEYEHPFFGSEQWKPGSIVYFGQLYQTSSMLYDIENEKLIIESLNGDGTLMLRNEKITSFTLDNHTFVRLEKEKTGLSTGFYELLYNGTVKVFVKRTKTQEKVVINQERTIRFSSNNQFYQYKGGVYYAVHGKASVMELMEDQKKALKAYWREKNIDFQQNRESALIKTSAYYDQLTHP
ncbi:MAG: hypothetical protein V4714_00765 [Bacteroidota bacterium]